MERSDMDARVRLTLGDDIYHLGEHQDVPELRARLLTAVRAGGDFLDLSSRQDGSILVLVAGGLPVKIERFELDADDDHTWDAGPRDDPDYYQL
jgi:hypothetical protein